jgi:hypothetical protein
MSVESTLVLINTLAYFVIRTLGIRNVYRVQAPWACIIKSIMAVIYGFPLECLSLASLFSIV